MRMLFVALLAIAFAANAQATVYSVTTTADTGAGSFRQAIVDSNAVPGGIHQIVFPAAFPANGVVTLGSDLPSIQSNFLQINGGSKAPVIDGNSQYSILRIGNSTTRLDLGDITLQDGLAVEAGGCVFASDSNSNSPALSATRVTISNCRVNGTNLVRGGGIYWGGTGGSVSLIDSRLISNRVSATTGESGGGGVYTGGNFLSLRTLFDGNAALGAISGSDGGGVGGAVVIAGSGSSVVIIESKFSSNNASFSGPAFGFGGAVALGCANCSVQILRSYFVGNSANFGGGIYARQQSVGAGDLLLDVANNTFRNNGAAQQGGAMSMGFNTFLSATNNTFYNSDATSGAHLAFFTNPSVTLFRANLLAPTLVGAACFGAFTAPTPSDINVNLLSDSSCASLAAGALPSTPLGDISIDSRPDQGTVLRFSGSAVIDSIGMSSLCEPRDARFTLRPLDGNGDGIARCDVGAYEASFDNIFFSGFDSFVPLAGASGVPLQNF